MALDNYTKTRLMSPLAQKLMSQHGHSSLFPNSQDEQLANLQNQISNYQTRIGAIGQPVPEPENKTNWFIKALQWLDTPRNAVWNAVEDTVKGENGFFQGLKEGWNNTERYEGTDLFEDLGVENKFVKGVGGFLTEAVLDPLNLVSLGAGSLTKGLITGTGKSLTKEGAEALAKAGLRKVSKETAEKLVKQQLAKAGKKVTKSQFDDMVEQLVKKNLDEVAQRYGLNADDILQDINKADYYNFAETLKRNPDATIEEMERLRRAGEAGSSRFDDFADTAGVLKQAEKHSPPIEELEKAFKEFMKKTKREGTQNTAEFMDMWARAGYKMEDLEDLIKHLPEDTADFGKFFDDISRSKIEDLPDLYRKGMDEFYDRIGYDIDRYYNDIYSKAHERIAKAILDQQDVMNKSRKGLSIAGKNLINAGKMQDIGANLSKKIRESGTLGGNIFARLQDGVNKLFDSKYIAGLDSTGQTVIKTLKKTRLGEKALNDEQLFALGKELDQVFEALEKKGIKDQKEWVVAYLEGNATEKMLHPEALEVAKKMKQEFKKMGLKEQEIGALTNLLDEGYFPHVPSWDNETLRNKIRLGGVTGRLKLDNPSALRRKYSSDLATAQKQLLFDTASREAKEEFLQKAGLVEGKVRLTPDDIDDIIATNNGDVWDILKDGGGIDKFFEDDPVRAFITRGLRHNKILAEKEFLDDVLEAFGETVSKSNIKDYLNAGYDVVIPKSRLKAFLVNNKGIGTLNKLDTLGKVKKEGAGTGVKELTEIEHILARIKEDSPDAFVKIGADEYTLLAKHYPIEAYALPQGVVQQINNASKRQVSEGIKVITDVVDAFYRLWKPTVTGLRPEYHLRNLAGSTFQNILDIGFKTFDPRINRIALKVAKGTDDVVELYGQKFTAKELNEMMIRTHAKSTYFRADADSLERALKSEMDKVSIKHPIKSLEKAGKYAGNLVEDRVRAVNFVANLENALEKGLSKDQAMNFAGEMVSKFHFDYSDLTDAEKQIFRRVFPFYTWVRKNLPLQLELALNSPATYSKIEKYNRNMTEAYDVDTSSMPEWFESSLPLPVPFMGENDGKSAFLATSLPPAELGMLAPKEGFKDVMNMVTPLVKVPFEFANNRKMITGAPISRYEGDTTNVAGIDMNAYLAHALSQFGVLRDVSRATSQPNQEGKAVARRPLVRGTGLSMPLVRDYDSDESYKDKMYDYNRQLGNYVQYLRDNGMDVPDVRTIEKLMKYHPEYLQLIQQSGLVPPIVYKLQRGQ